LFAYPGVGTYLVNAVNLRDVGAVAAVAMILAALYIAINLVADVIVVFLVPKLRTGL
jgi:peptide/nickel transport system permease protein